jgi:hypothetical protein
MATITKKAAKRINELLSDASLYKTLGDMSAGDGTSDYYRHAYREGVAVRALFDEFGIESGGLESYFTEDKVESFRIAADASHAERWAALKARLDAELEAEMQA